MSCGYLLVPPLLFQQLSGCHSSLLLSASHISLHGDHQCLRRLGNLCKGEVLMDLLPKDQGTFLPGYWSCVIDSVTPKLDIYLVPGLRSCFIHWICCLVPVVLLLKLTPDLTPKYSHLIFWLVSSWLLFHWRTTAMFQISIVTLHYSAPVTNRWLFWGPWHGPHGCRLFTLIEPTSNWLWLRIQFLGEKWNSICRP